jgi:tRNA A37 threonylcarbamoyladenosine synthetase subunit TsaC/SUA5/YrdC
MAYPFVVDQVDAAGVSRYQDGTLLAPGMEIVSRPEGAAVTAQLHEARGAPPSRCPAGVLGDPAAESRAARALAAGSTVGVGFANLYALVSRADPTTVRRVNLRKGRPAGQVASVTTTPSRVLDAWDLDRLPPGLTPAAVRAVVDAFFALGPFGFRGPARAGLPTCLTAEDGDLPTTQLIAPGYACPANAFLQRALEETGDDLLSITSANRSRHRTGADDVPAHWRAAGLAPDFGRDPGFVLLPHRDEAAARRAYPQHLPMSTTVLALHTTTYLPDDPRPQLRLERHGSLDADTVRAVLAGFGFGLALGPDAGRRLVPRRYPDAAAAGC